MYKDIIRYELAEGVTEEHLYKVAADVHENWMKNQKGFIAWEIHKDQDGNFLDLVYWESEADAKASNADMGNIPNADKWFACYTSGSIKSQNISLLKRF